MLLEAGTRGVSGERAAAGGAGVEERRSVRAGLSEHSSSVVRTSICSALRLRVSPAHLCVPSLRYPHQPLKCQRRDGAPPPRRTRRRAGLPRHHAHARGCCACGACARCTPSCLLTCASQPVVTYSASTPLFDKEDFEQLNAAIKVRGACATPAACARTCTLTCAGGCLSPAIRRAARRRHPPLPRHAEGGQDGHLLLAPRRRPRRGPRPGAGRSSRR